MPGSVPVVHCAVLDFLCSSVLGLPFVSNGFSLVYLFQLEGDTKMAFELVIEMNISFVKIVCSYCLIILPFTKRC